MAPPPPTASLSPVEVCVQLHYRELQPFPRHLDDDIGGREAVRDWHGFWLETDCTRDPQALPTSGNTPFAIWSLFLLLGPGGPAMEVVLRGFQGQVTGVKTASPSLLGGLALELTWYVGGLPGPTRRLPSFRFAASTSRHSDASPEPSTPAAPETLS